MWVEANQNLTVCSYSHSQATAWVRGICCVQRMTDCASKWQSCAKTACNCYKHFNVSVWLTMCLHCCCTPLPVSEGQRKAHYEELDGEKKRNKDKIKQLKKEIKNLNGQLTATGQVCYSAKLSSYSKEKASWPKWLSGCTRLETYTQAAETESEHAAVDAGGWHTAWCVQGMGASSKQVCAATVSSVFLKRPVCVITSAHHSFSQGLMIKEAFTIHNRKLWGFLSHAVS